MNSVLSPKLDFCSLEELLANNARNFSGKEAIVYFNVDTGETTSLTYFQLYETVKKTALFLSSLGIKENSRFAILMENAPEILLFELGGALLGATAVPLDLKRDTLERKVYKLRQTNAQAVFIKLGNTQTNAKFSARAKNLAQFDVESDTEIESLKKTVPGVQIISWTDFNEFLKLLPDPNDPNESFGKKDFSQTYVILYTSGTTAHPKGVILSQKACLLNAQGIALWQKFNEQDRFAVILPLHHINSTIFCLSILLVGGTIILNSRYSRTKFWPMVKKFKATNTSLVPTILHDLLTEIIPDDFSTSLKRICIGSAPVLPDETFRFYQKFKVKVIQGYGQTETALRVSGVPVDLPADDYLKLLKSNSIGTQLANNRLAIMNENNQEKKEGEEGEICIKGQILAKGYLNDQEATDKAFVNGWFHSGDLGKFKVIDQTRYYYIVGRLKEIIIKGGVNISPSVVEDWLIKTFPQVEEAAVVGIFDERMGEEIAAAVVSKKNIQEKDKKQLAEQILHRANNREVSDISQYEMPKKVFLFEQLPKTSTGKIQRVEVKKTVLEKNLRVRSSRLHSNNKKTGNYTVRQIKSEEKAILSRAVEINNQRFGIKSTLSDFVCRARNGYVFGYFDQKGSLLGSLCCLPANYRTVLKYQTYQEASGMGTFKNSVRTGDTLLCMAISVVSATKTQKEQNNRPSTSSGNNTIYKNLLKLAPQEVINYVKSGQDHVLSFHQNAKGGLRGAKVLKILPDSRPEDREALGYNVIMAYPTISKDTKIIINDTASPAVALIEKILQTAQESGVKHVLAFSRPAGFKKYLENIQK